MPNKLSLSAVVFVIAMSGCDTGSAGSREATGVLTRALIGSGVGRSMDETDRLRPNQAILRSYSSPLGKMANGNHCREFRQTITIDRRRETGIGVACLQGDGTWRIVN